MTSGDLNIDVSEKLTEVVSKWFLTSFRTFFFRFSLRRTGAELDGGGRLEAPPRPTTEVSEHRPGAG